LTYLQAVIGPYRLNLLYYTFSNSKFLDLPKGVVDGSSVIFLAELPTYYM